MYTNKKQFIQTTTSILNFKQKYTRVIKLDLVLCLMVLDYVQLSQKRAILTVSKHQHSFEHKKKIKMELAVLSMTFCTNIINIEINGKFALNPILVVCQSYYGVKQKILESYHKYDLTKCLKFRKQEMFLYSIYTQKAMAGYEENVIKGPVQKESTSSKLVHKELSYRTCNEINMNYPLHFVEIYFKRQIFFLKSFFQNINNLSHFEHDVYLNKVNYFQMER